EIPSAVIGAANEPPVFLKNCLANYYNFVTMRGVHEEDPVFLWGLVAAACSADCNPSLDICRSHPLCSGSSNNGAGNRRHRRGSAERLRRATRVFAQPFLQRSKRLRIAAVGIFLRRTF